MPILPFQSFGLRSMPDSRTVTNCFTPPARFRRTARIARARIASRIASHLMYPVQVVIFAVLALLLSILLLSLALWWLG